VTVKQYQYISTLTTLPDEVKLGKTICCLYSKKQKEVEQFSKLKILWYSYLIERQLTNISKPKLFTYRLQADATKLTLGQFIDINYWLKLGQIEALHLVAATLLNTPNHKQTAEKILNDDIRNIYGGVNKFYQSFAELLENYSELFEPINEDEEQHPFIEQFGWLFSAKSIAEHLGVNMEAAYKVNIIEALNTLAYLKSYNEYQLWQSKQTASS